MLERKCIVERKESEEMMDGDEEEEAKGEGTSGSVVRM